MNPNERNQAGCALIPNFREEAQENPKAFCQRNGLPAPDADSLQAAAWIATEAAGHALRTTGGLPHPKKIWPPDTERKKQEKKAEFHGLHPHVKISRGIHAALTVGSGELDMHGFWEYGDYEAARTWERLHPEDGEC